VGWWLAVLVLDCGAFFVVVNELVPNGLQCRLGRFSIWRAPCRQTARALIRLAGRDRVRWLDLLGGGGGGLLHGWIGRGVLARAEFIGDCVIAVVFVAVFPLRNLFGRFGGLVCFRAVLLFSVPCFTAR
jgi:hypothetical protein